MAIGTWIGQVTALANHFPLPPHLRSERCKFMRDSEGIKPRCRVRKRCAESSESSVEAKRPKLGDLSACAWWVAMRERIAARSVAAARLIVR
jgi:hypothetical protein